MKGFEMAKHRITEEELKRERWIFARQMYRGKNNTGYSKRYYNVFNGEIVGDTAVWDWDNKENPLVGGRIRVVAALEDQ
jgi:hypothetical protein